MSTWARNTEEVICPYCGAKNQLTDLYSDLRGPESAEAECYECEKTFVAHFHVNISVRAEKLSASAGLGEALKGGDGSYKP